MIICLVGQEEKNTQKTIEPNEALSIIKDGKIAAEGWFSMMTSCLEREKEIFFIISATQKLKSKRWGLIF